MPREAADVKALRYLSSARLIVTKVDGRAIEAVCRGDSGVVYTLGWEAIPKWWCSCPAVRDHCAHLIALRRVALVPGSTSLTKPMEGAS
jgi:hypothetical protein